MRAAYHGHMRALLRLLLPEQVLIVLLVERHGPSQRPRLVRRLVVARYLRAHAHALGSCVFVVRSLAGRRQAVLVNNGRAPARPFDFERVGLPDGFGDFVVEEGCRR